MRLSIVYGFDTAPTANRFLNDVNSHLSLDNCKAKLFDRDKVRVFYSLDKDSYDNTLSLLDDLSAAYEGSEIEG
jgi:hypothetical protein